MGLGKFLPPTSRGASGGRGHHTTLPPYDCPTYLENECTCPRPRRGQLLTVCSCWIFRSPRYLALIERPLNCLNCRRTSPPRPGDCNYWLVYCSCSSRIPPAGCRCIEDHSLVHRQRAAPIPVPSLPYTCLVSWTSRPIFIPPSRVIMVNHVSLAAPRRL